MPGQNDACMVAIAIIHKATLSFPLSSFISVSFSQGNLFCPGIRSYLLYKQKIVQIFHNYVTGYWKTDQNVTLGIFNFIVPADRYTQTLATHALLH